MKLRAPPVNCSALKHSKGVRDKRLRMGVRLSTFLSLSAATIGNGSCEGIFAPIEGFGRGENTDGVDWSIDISSVVSIDRSRTRSVTCQLSSSLHVHDANQFQFNNEQGVSLGDTWKR